VGERALRDVLRISRVAAHAHRKSVHASLVTRDK
jgi:hypothetical protein